MVDVKLEACPFCGSELVRRTKFAFAHEAKGCLLTGYGVTRAEVDRWNTRSIPSPPEGEIGGILAELQSAIANYVDEAAAVVVINHARSLIARLAAERDALVAQIEFCSGSCELPEALRPAPSGAEQDRGA